MSRFGPAVRRYRVRLSGKQKGLGLDSKGRFGFISFLFKMVVICAGDTVL